MTDNHYKKGKEIHLGIIPDGNRRFAVSKGLKTFGHKEGSQKLKQVLKWCMNYHDITEISVFALSADNLKRPAREVKELWNVYKQEFENMLKDDFIKDNSIKVKILGDMDLWKPSVKTLAKEIIRTTSSYSKRILNLLLAYTSKFELTRALTEVVRKEGKEWEKFLLINKPVDLLIRTGGQRRLSGFLLYQISYAEIYFTDTLFPNFSRQEFDKIIKWYYRQQKNFGE